ncbi:MAG: 2OG-Fe(II) oxygenase family protein [Gammaproteobacteria bacterium]
MAIAQSDNCTARTASGPDSGTAPLHPRAASWQLGSDVLTLFPTFVWKLQLAKALQESIANGLMAVLGEQRGRNASLSPGESWQSIQTLHEQERLGELASCIHAATRRVLNFLKTSHADFEITGCWANILAPGAGHNIHHHPNNYLSGVYYVATCRGADTINFHDPRIQTGIIRPPVTELTSGNTDLVVVRVQNGSLLLFPSYLPHSVTANRSDKERISVSFNIMFSHFTERLSQPLWEPAAQASGGRAGESCTPAT